MILDEKWVLAIASESNIRKNFENFTELGCSMGYTVAYKISGQFMYK